MTKKRGVPRRRVSSRGDARQLPARHYVPNFDLERALERRIEPTAADDERLLAIVNRTLDFSNWCFDDKEHALVERREREAYAVECASNGGNFNQLVYFFEDMNLLSLARWARAGMPVDRRRRAVQDRKVHWAALELPAIQQILREHCGDGSRERAIPFACRRHNIKKVKTLRNHLRSRHRPKFK